MKLYYVTMKSDEECVLESFICFIIADNIKEAKKLLLNHQDSMELITEYDDWFCDVRIKMNKNEEVDINGLSKGCYLYELSYEEILRRKIYTTIYDWDKEEWIDYQDLYRDDEK